MVWLQRAYPLDLFLHLLLLGDRPLVDPFLVFTPQLVPLGAAMNASSMVVTLGLPFLSSKTRMVYSFPAFKVMSSTGTECFSLIEFRK